MIINSKIILSERINLSRVFSLNKEEEFEEKTKDNFNIIKQLAYSQKIPGVNSPLKPERFVNDNEMKISAQLLTSNPFLKKIVEHDSGKNVLRFISEQVNLSNAGSILLSLRRKFFYENNNFQQIRNVINLNPINQHKDASLYFKYINSILPDAGIYIGCYEDYFSRKKRISKKYPNSIHKFIFFLDFIIHRVIPKLCFTKHIYFSLVRNTSYAFSKAETLGRLCHAGFEIITDERIGELSYFSVIKTRKPKKDMHTSCGPIFSMQRISKDGKKISVYKIRTMHPYSEYLQDYIVKMNGYNKTGKPNNDFRITGWSRMIRKCYIDEIPQIINVLKGELNVFGVRPLTEFGFKTLPPDLQKERIKYKPGCIPPNVALGLKGLPGVIWAERLYLRKMKRKPWFTNFQFFWMAMFNLIMKKSTSS